MEPLLQVARHTCSGGLGVWRSGLHPILGAHETNPTNRPGLHHLVIRLSIIWTSCDRSADLVAIVSESCSINVDIEFVQD